MKSKPSHIIQYILLLFIGLYLSWLFFNGLNINELTQTIRTGNFSWFYLVMLVSVLVYVIRVLRWQMLIRATGHETPFLTAFSALSIGYFVNFAVPRLGEITRCLSVKKYSDIPFMKLLGTVIVERVVDIISLLIVLLLTILLQFNQTIEFFRENVFHPLYNGIIVKIINGNNTLLITAMITIMLAAFLLFYFRKYTIKRSPKIILQFIKSFKDGLVSITKLERKKTFVLYTFLIWVCYFLMTYFWFFVFKETSVLGWGACLTILSIGTVGRSIPIQGGGMGAYHFLVQQVVVLYGIGGLLGKTLATLIHAGQTFFTFAMGLVGLIIFFVNYWRNK
ncbi:MAG: flippase-like domain-containing protein [Bacteroidetes bacterium]|nr:flippase-like domain-containing protein [Bacteroidota bacterium]